MNRNSYARQYPTHLLAENTPQTWDTGLRRSARPLLHLALPQATSCPSISRDSRQLPHRLGLDDLLLAFTVAVVMVSWSTVVVSNAARRQQQ